MMIDVATNATDAAVIVVLISGGAPYLGGSATWKPLRELASDYRFVEIDSLSFADAPDIEAAAVKTIETALCEATAVVAHFNVAALVLESAARRRPDLPIMLISPLLVLRRTGRSSLVGALLGFPSVSSMLTAYAKSKTERLKNDRDYIRKQMRFLVPDPAISEALLDQAQSRCRDPRADRAAARTPEVLRMTLRVLSESAQAVLAKATILVGSGEVDQKTAQRLKVNVLTGNGASAMLESPQAVADELRTLIAQNLQHNSDSKLGL